MFNLLFKVATKTYDFCAVFAFYLLKALSLLFCEPTELSIDACQQLLSKLLISLTSISWWLSIYTFSEYPPLSLFLLLGSSISVVFNCLSFNLKLRAFLSAGFSSLAYGNLLIVNFNDLLDLMQIIHFGSYIMLFLSALYAFISLTSRTFSYQCISWVELIACGLAAIFEPVYWLLVIQNVIALCIGD